MSKNGNFDTIATVQSSVFHWWGSFSVGKAFDFGCVKCAQFQYISVRSLTLRLHFSCPLFVGEFNTHSYENATFFVACTLKSF